MAGIDAEVGDQLACQCRDEPYVVDPLPVGLRRTAAVSPTEVNTVGVRHEEPMGVGDGIVVRIPLLIRPGRAGAMQVHHETYRLVETGGHVQAVGANEASEIKPLRLAGNGPSTPGTDSGKARDHTKCRQRQMATTSDGQARS